MKFVTAITALSLLMSFSENSSAQVAMLSKAVVVEKVSAAKQTVAAEKGVEIGKEAIENKITEDVGSEDSVVLVTSSSLSVLEIFFGKQFNELSKALNKPYIVDELIARRLGYTEKEIARLPKASPATVRLPINGVRLAMRGNLYFTAGLVGYAIGQKINELDEKHLESYINTHVGNVIGPAIAEGDVVKSAKNATIPLLLARTHAKEILGIRQPTASKNSLSSAVQ